MEFQVYKDGNKEWRWRLVAGNNRIIGTSGEGYKKRKHTLEIVEKIIDGCAGQKIKVRTIRAAKILLSAVVFCFVFAGGAYAQKTEVDQDFLDDAAKAFTLVVEQREAIDKLKEEIATLKKLVVEIERSKQSPCTLAQEKVKNDLVFWLDRYAAAGEAERSQIEKVIKDLRRSSKKLLASQCDYSNQSDLMKALDVGSRFLPLLLIFK